MTARERIKAYQTETGCCFADVVGDDFETEMVALVQAAIAEEREACAIAALNARPHPGKNCGCGECVGSDSAVAAIRARSTT